MNDSENQAQSIVQNRLMSADQVATLFHNFQAEPRGSADFCEFLEQQQLINPVLASQVRASSRSSSQRMGQANPLDVHTQCVDTAAMYRAQDHLPPSLPGGRGNTLKDFSLHGSIESGGENLGPYRLVRELGRGGMGVVYQALDTKLGREVALKMLRPEDAMDLIALERFEIEAQAMARLHHPNIIEIYSIDKFQGVICLAMPLISGGALSDLLKNGVPLEFERAIELCQKIALGLAHAHERNIIHRDLKPDNILLNGAGDPVITDFGLAKAVDSNSTGVSKTGQFVGTINFTSPEQIQGSRAIDGRADVFSLGVTLFLMLTSRLPFQGASNIETVKHVLRSKAPKLSHFRADVPEALETIVSRCLCKDPDDRYSTATELAADCARWLIGEGISANPVSSKFGWGKSGHGDHSRWLAAGFAILLVFASIVIVLTLSFNAELEEISQQKKLAEAKMAKSADKAGKLAKNVSEEADNSQALRKELRRVQGLTVAGHSLGKSYFIEADLTGMDFSGVFLKSGRFQNCVAKKTVFQSATLENCTISHCDFSESDFTAANMKNIELKNVNFNGCNFDSVKWSGVSYDSKTRWPAAFDPSVYGLEKREETAPNKRPTIYKDGRDRQVVLDAFNTELKRINQHVRSGNLTVCASRMATLLRNFRDTLSQESPSNLGVFHMIFNRLLTLLRKKNGETLVNKLIILLPKKHQGRYEKMRSSRSSQNINTYMNVVYRSILKGDYKNALTQCEKLIRMNPRVKPFKLAVHGWIADRSGRYKDARSYFKEFVSLDWTNSRNRRGTNEVTVALSYIPAYLEIATKFEALCALYEKRMKELEKEAKNEKVKAFIGRRSLRSNKNTGLPLRKTALLPFPPKKKGIDKTMEILRSGQNLPNYMKMLEETAKTYPTYVPILVQLSEVHPVLEKRMTYAMAALEIIRSTPEFTDDQDLHRITETLKLNRTLRKFAKSDAETTERLEVLLNSALKIRANCHVQMIAERLSDRVGLPSVKRKYRELLNRYPALKMIGRLWVKTDAEVMIKLNGKILLFSKSQAATKVSFPLGSVLEIHGEAKRNDEKGLMLVLQLKDGRLFFLSPRQYSQQNKRAVGRLATQSYHQLKNLNLEFPICWGEPKNEKDENRSLHVLHRLEFIDFRHYYDYGWTYKKQ